MPAVNERIYGTAEQWERLKTAGNDSDTLLVPTRAYFGETPKSDGTTTTDYMMGTLSTAYLNGKLQVNEPIDTSICPIGCDAGFQVRQVTYYPPRNNANTEKITTKVEGTAPLFFQTYYSNPSTFKHSADFHLNNSTNIERAAWAYDMQPSSQSLSNYTYLRNWDGPVVPITSMPVKSSVWCIFVGCSPVTEWNTVTSSPNLVIYDLNSYVNGTVTISGQTYKVHEYYPEIIWIGVRLFTSTDTNVQNIKRDSSTYFYGASFSQEINDFQYNDDTTLHMLRYDAYPWTGILSNWRYLNNNNLETDSRDARAFIVYGKATAQFISTNTANQWYGVAGVGITTESVYNSDYRMWQHSNLIERWGDIESFKEFCLTQCAYFGMFFTADYTVARDGELDAENMYLGIIDDSGITHGQYSQGQDNRKQKQWDWNDLINDSPYDPTKEDDNDPNEYDNRTILNPNPINTGFGKFTKSYAMQGTEIFFISRFLYNTIAENVDNDTYLLQRFLTNNPIDCITSLMVFPFDLNKLFGSSPEQIYLGNQPVTYVLPSGISYAVNGIPITEGTAIIDCGSCTYYRQYKDFRDYEPYSNAEISIPYCGSIPISPAEYMGHTISVKLLVDFNTGGCMALIYRDELVTDSITGTVGSQVSVTGIQQADYNNAVYNANANLKRAQLGQLSQISNAIISTGVQAASGNAGGALSGLMNAVTGTMQSNLNIQQAEYELQHIQTPYKTLGTSTPVTSMCNEQSCRLILKRPQMLDNYNPSQYGHTVGFACLITAPLSNFTGFTQATNVDLSGVTATVTEKQMIQQQLQSGVYL